MRIRINTRSWKEVVVVVVLAPVIVLWVIVEVAICTVILLTAGAVKAMKWIKSKIRMGYGNNVKD